MQAVVQKRDSESVEKKRFPGPWAVEKKHIYFLDCLPSRKGREARNETNRTGPLAFLANDMQCQEGAICICDILLWADRIRKQETYEVNLRKHKYATQEENETEFFVVVVVVVCLFWFILDFVCLCWFLFILFYCCCCCCRFCIKVMLV